ncbi:MAG: hypothetical protein MUF34_19360, partial [Polyangiaceae bacterium]|nr:hypothetical protein [Polyangiaceae bacterium]
QKRRPQRIASTPNVGRNASPRRQTSAATHRLDAKRRPQRIASTQKRQPQRIASTQKRRPQRIASTQKRRLTKP